MSAKNLRGKQISRGYSESGRCEGRERSTEKQQDRQSLFKGCRQDECSMCIKCEASRESSGEGEEKEAERQRGKE